MNGGAFASATPVSLLYTSHCFADWMERRGGRNRISASRSFSCGLHLRLRQLLLRLLRLLLLLLLLLLLVVVVVVLWFEVHFVSSFGRVVQNPNDIDLLLLTVLGLLRKGCPHVYVSSNVLSSR